jgi:UDP-N-acetylglucosamine 2-epimerase (non-hydrolysing)
VRVLLVIGTRPEAIKLAPIIRALRADGSFQTTICLTSQHQNLVGPILSFFNIRADVDLGVMTPGQTLNEVTSKVLTGVGELLRRDSYDVVIVQGDTCTALAAGLAAFYARVPLAHVEAGLRSGDLDQPFPEEAHRRQLDLLSRWLFVPTRQAAVNLEAEGYRTDRIFVTGNTVIDALWETAPLVRPEGKQLPAALPARARLVLLTAHRRESFGPGLASICKAVAALADRHPDLHVLYPVHPNPQVVEAANRHLRGHQRVHLVPPLEYPDFVRALLAADLVLTDSGGVQEEAPALGKRVLVLRETTERPEGVASGVAELVGTDPDRILERASTLLELVGTQSRVCCPYGDGRASQRIVEVLKTGGLTCPFEPGAVVAGGRPPPSFASAA